MESWNVLSFVPVCPGMCDYFGKVQTTAEKDFH